MPRDTERNFTVELVFADDNRPHRFGLLADLVLEEILRQRQAASMQQTLEEMVSEEETIQ